MKAVGLLFLSIIALPALPQAPASGAAPVKAAAAEAESTEPPPIPERRLEFAPVESDPSVALSPATSLPVCDSGGSLFLDMLDPKDPKSHSVVAIKGKKSQRYSLSGISDLHDLFVFGFFPSESVVGFLVRATKETPVAAGPGVSPAGYAWSGYHTYIAEFNRDGSYKGSIEIPVTYQLTRFAILPSGEFLVAGFDKVNATARLLFLNSSGEVVRNLDMPAFKKPVGDNAQYGSIETGRAARKVIGSVVFTPYGQDILVWNRNGSDPILDVGPGGRVREVPLDIPAGSAFVDLVSANDRWVAHFRDKDTAEHAPFTAKAFSYYELHPQDASIWSRIQISGDVPQSLACESDGTYLTFKSDKDNKIMMFEAR
jgi:hypothetical protein